MRDQDALTHVPCVGGLALTTVFILVIIMLIIVLILVRIALILVFMQVFMIAYNA